jgi:hypothetical protein
VVKEVLGRNQVGAAMCGAFFCPKMLGNTTLRYPKCFALIGMDSSSAAWCVVCLIPGRSALFASVSYDEFLAKKEVSQP